MRSRLRNICAAVIGRFVPTLIALAHSPTAVAQGFASSLSGSEETYFIFDRPHQGSRFRQSWLQVADRISDDWKLVATDTLNGDGWYADENFVEYDQRTIVVRAGRFRSEFGFSSWADRAYNVVARLPIVRSENLLPTLALDRLDDGAEVQATSGEYQITVGALDVTSGDRQLTASRANRAQARGQVRLGALILGASALASAPAAQSAPGALYGLDARWTTPQVLVKGEFVRGENGSMSDSGYYVDFTFRPRNIYRTELGARVEGFEASRGGGRAALTTLGIRQILGPAVTTNLNYGWGRTFGDSKDLRGWSLQTVLTVHF